MADQPAAYVVVVEVEKRSITVGPYRTFKRADGDARAWDGADGRSCWVEPVTSPEQYQKLRQQDSKS